MSAHTPGPWSDFEKQRGDSGFIIRARGCVIGEVLDQSHGIGRANARLIAAAPDLLAALQTVEDTVGLLIDLTEPKQDCRQLRDTIRAALAKAKGEA